MKGFIEVRSPGLYTSVQDRGRFGFRKYGVPSSGSMDQYSAELSNHLLNNSPDAAVLEITLHGPLLIFSISTQIVISGANISPRLNDREIANNKIISVKAGDQLSFGLLQSGTRCYLAVKGGIDSEKIMGSRSHFTPVTTRPTIQKGDRLPITSHESDNPSYSTVK